MSKPHMTDAQYRTLGACIARADSAGTEATAVRYADTTTVKTLIAMAKPGRRWVTLNHGREDARRVITSGTVTNAGRTAYRLETERRAREAAAADALARVMAIGAPAAEQSAPRVSITASVDPFALCRTRELELAF